MSYFFKAKRGCLYFTSKLSNVVRPLLLLQLFFLIYHRYMFTTFVCLCNFKEKFLIMIQIMTFLVNHDTEKLQEDYRCEKNSGMAFTAMIIFETISSLLYAFYMTMDFYN